MSQSAFLTRIRSILQRKESIPRLTLSSNTSEMLSDDDLETNLSTYIQIFTNEYVQRQGRAMEEIRSREKYLSQLQETQMNQKEQLKQKSVQINEKYQKLRQQFEQVTRIE